MSNNYATKQDLQETETRLSQSMEAMETRVSQSMEAMETRLLQFMEAMENRLVEHTAQAVQDAETRILKATYHYIETIQTRVGGFAAEVNEVKTRMALMEQRVLDLEKRVNLGPQ